MCKNRLKILNRLWEKWEMSRPLGGGGDFLTHTVHEWACEAVRSAAWSSRSCWTVIEFNNHLLFINFISSTISCSQSRNSFYFFTPDDKRGDSDLDLKTNFNGLLYLLHLPFKLHLGLVVSIIGGGEGEKIMIIYYSTSSTRLYSVVSDLDLWPFTLLTCWVGLLSIWL